MSTTYHVTNSASPEALLIVGLVFLGIGIVFILIAVLFTAIQNATDKNCTERTFGEVVSVNDRNVHFSGNVGTRSNTTVYAPVFRFYANGEWVQASPKVYTSKQNYPAGTQVPILYDRNNPSRVIIEGTKGFKLFYIIFYSVGIAMFLIGLIVMITSIV